MPDPQQQTPQQDPFASLYSASPPPTQAQPPASATPAPLPPTGNLLGDAALGMLHAAATHPAITGQDTPASAPASAPESSDDPFAHLYGSAASTRSAPLQTANSADPFASLYSGSAHVDPGVPPVSDPDEGFFGQAWDWANKPLLDLHREGAGPIEHGAETFASGMTSPLSIGLLLLTGGLGSLAEGAGAEALSAFSPEIAAAVGPAADSISKLMQAGFTGQQIYSVAQAVPRVADAIKAGDTDSALDLGTQAILSGMAAGISAKGLADRFGKSEFEFPGDKEAIGAHQHAAENANFTAKNFEDANKDLIRNTPLDMAAQLYHEAGGDVSVLDRQRQEIQDSPKVSDAIKGKYDVLFKQAMNLPDDVKAVSDTIRADYAHGDYSLERAQQLGMLDPEKAGAANYAGQHTYVPEDADASDMRPPTTAGSKSPAFTKARSFATLTDAIKEGYEPTDVGLAGARGKYIRQFGQGEGLRAAETVLQQTKADDTRPIGVDPAKVRPIDGVRAIALPQGADIAKLTAEGRIVYNDVDKPYLDVSDYKPGPDKFSKFRVKQTLFNDQGESQPVFERANLLVHPDYLKPVMQAFQDTSWFKQNNFTNKLLQISTQAKKSLLSLSPFHWFTEGERGLQMGLNPAEVFRPPQIDPDGLAMSKGTKYGLTLYGDTSARSLADEGVSSAGNALIHKIPVVGNLLKSAEDQLFGNYIPRLKAAAFEKVADQLGKKNPNWSEAEVMTRASKITNGAFGGINWRQLGYSMSTQDALRLAFLAPDFTGSQIMFGHAGLQAGGSVVWQSMARIALYNMLAAQTINLLNTGSVHMDHPFSVVSKDGKNLYSVRTMPEDIAHYLTDPRGSIYNRLNPITSKPAVEFLSGKDQSGRNVSYGQQLGDLLKNVVPITLQGAIPRPDQSFAQQAFRGAGIQTTPNRSTAENLAIQKVSARGPEGTIQQGQIESHQLANHMIDQVRNHQIGPQEITQAIVDGKITRNQAARITREALMPPLVGRVSSLPLSDALDVYSVATQAEKQELLPEMRKKIATFHKNAVRTKTPQEIQYLNQRIQQAGITFGSTVPSPSVQVQPQPQAQPQTQPQLQAQAAEANYDHDYHWDANGQLVHVPTP
jgi:hypothetical protein